MKEEKWDIKVLPALFDRWQPKNSLSKQVVVLMSGGVDSSVTAYLLKKAGWDVLGITMQIPVENCSTGRGCCGSDAAFVCSELGIAHHFIDVKDAFRKLIIEPFQRAYADGRTPNPCVDCNTLLKFSVVWDFMLSEFGIEYLATGHYGCVVEEGGKFRLRRAKDKTKDQSYFIYGVPAEKLSRLILPLGDLEKGQVRSTAAEFGLSVAEKAESMELCFAGEGDYRKALTEDQAENPGDITDMGGNVIGAHKGISNYTLGQRRGVGFAGGVPLYVGRIDAKANTIALGTREQLYCCVIRADEINVLLDEEFVVGRGLFGRIRSYSKPGWCKVISVGEGNVTVEFDEGQFAPCPGQRLVLYDVQETVVAGGVIVSASM